LNVLEIVKYEQDTFLPQVLFELFEQGLRPSFFQAENPSDS